MLDVLTQDMQVALLLTLVIKESTDYAPFLLKSEDLQDVQAKYFFNIKQHGFGSFSRDLCTLA
ncbi:hypothetical protein EDB36_1011168 [Vibrio crassostreae]|nr:hypothetical protein EDB36_1011168 [Vibrio crassostreae]CAK2145880.1 hypothetical protein VCRA2110O182_70011 [Vibrio crassostreae]